MAHENKKQAEEQSKRLSEILEILERWPNNGVLQNACSKLVRCVILDVDSLDTYAKPTALIGKYTQRIQSSNRSVN